MSTLNAPVASARRRAGDFALLAFLATVTMLFAAFTAAYMIRSTGKDFERFRLPGALRFSTAFLILSSITMEITRRSKLRSWMWTTVVLGLAFLGAQILAWIEFARTGMFQAANPHGSFFYMLTAVHGLHLAGGITALLYVAVRGRTPRLCAGYWHFMGALWIYLLVMLTQF